MKLEIEIHLVINSNCFKNPNKDTEVVSYVN